VVRMFTSDVCSTVTFGEFTSLGVMFPYCFYILRLWIIAWFRPLNNLPYTFLVEGY